MKTNNYRYLQIMNSWTRSREIGSKRWIGFKIVLENAGWLVWINSEQWQNLKKDK